MPTTPTDQRDENLSALRAAVANTTTLKTILSEDWFGRIEENIRTGVRPADPTGFLYDFSHMLRGVQWFEEIQAQIALHEAFAASDFAALSGVVLADSYRLHASTWHQGPRPDASLREKEAEHLNAWYGRSI